MSGCRHLGECVAPPSGATDALTQTVKMQCDEKQLVSVCRERKNNVSDVRKSRSSLAFPPHRIELVQVEFRFRTKDSFYL